MLSAADGFNSLKTEPGLDADRMQFNHADVFRRLIWAEIQIGALTYLQNDIDQLVALTARNCPSRPI
jgi:hypothetical protein